MKHHSSRINSLSNNYIFFTIFHISQAILNSYIVTHKNNKKGHKMCRGSFILTHKTKPNSPYVIAAECKKKIASRKRINQWPFYLPFLGTYQNWYWLNPMVLTCPPKKLLKIQTQLNNVWRDCHDPLVLQCNMQVTNLWAD